MNVKESAHHIINQLPEQASSNDIMYELYVKQKVKADFNTVEKGRTVSHDQVRAHITARHHKHT